MSLKDQRPAEVKQWLDNTYPAIKKQAQREDAEIHWADETGVRNSCQHGRSYAPKGQTPVRKSMAKRLSVNMISTVTNQGKVQFMIYSDTMNSERFIEFLQQLIKTNSRKLYVIADNLRVHHSRPVTEWVQEHEDQIALFFLPAYSPEKNPDEYLNCDLKQGMSQTPAPKDQSTYTKAGIDLRFK
ncbi:MAG: IS630 family transposase [Balneolaceae bacterium]|nr:IS630 family transposase [Balneolaceae bacterium]